MIVPAIGVEAGRDASRTPIDALVLDQARNLGSEAVRVLVHFETAPDARDAAALDAAGFRALVRYDIVPVMLAIGPADLAPALARVPRVTLVEADRVIPYSLNTATTTIGAKTLWDSAHTRWDSAGASVAVPSGIDGAGIGIAIVDSGVDATHPDLLLKDIGEATGARWTTLANYKIVGRDSVELLANTPPGDFLAANTLAIPLAHTDNTGGHGTHVAGAAAGSGVASDGKYTGAAPGAHLIGYGAGEALVVSLALAAFDHIAANHDALGIRVVSNSWGGAGDWQPGFAVTQAARRLVNDHGLVVVFAAGNSGGDGSSIQSSVWANIPETISVANWDERANFVHSSSSRGRRDLERTWPDVAAVGTNLISAAALGGPVTHYGNAQDATLLGGELVVPVPTPMTVNAGPVIVGPYASFTGTSMATPMVSGVIALILQANPDLSPSEVRDILRATARIPTGRSYADHGFALGRGLVDASSAVAVALRMNDGLTLANGLATATLAGAPLQINGNAPDAGALSVTMAAPAQVPAGIPVTFTATATGGDVYAAYDYAWDFNTDGITDATGASAEWTFATLGAASVRVTVSDGTATAFDDADMEVVIAAVPIFSDDMERGAGNWVVTNDGVTGPAQGWDLRTATQGVYFGGLFDAASGEAFWHAGLRHTPATGGWAYLPGAQSTIALAAPLDIAGAESVTLTYNVAGQSMAPLIIEASADGGAWTRVDTVTGNLVWGGGVLFYESRTVDLSAFAGASLLDIRYRYDPRVPNVDLIDLLFWSVFESASWGGWAVDDVGVDAVFT